MVFFLGNQGNYAHAGNSGGAPRVNHYNLELLDSLARFREATQSTSKTDGTGCAMTGLCSAWQLQNTGDHVALNDRLGLNTMPNHPTDYARNGINLNDNEAMTHQIHSILQPESYSAQLYAQLQTLEPESPEAQKTQSQLAQMMTREGYADREIQEVFLLMNIQKSNDAQNSLMMISPQLSGPQNEAVQARQSALMQHNEQLKAAYKDLALGMPQF